MDSKKDAYRDFGSSDCSPADRLLQLCKMVSIPANLLKQEATNYSSAKEDAKQWQRKRKTN